MSALKRRLMIRPGAIGDCLCWLPVLAAIGATHAEVWAPGPVLPLLELAPCRRNLAASGFSLLGISGMEVPQETISALRGFDEILSWSGWNQPELKAACQRLDLPITFFPALPGPESTVPVSDWFLQQTERWHGLSEEPSAWRQERGRRFLLPLLGQSRHTDASRLVVLHPFSGSPAKNWPLAHYRALAAFLQDLPIPGLRVQWCAGPEDPLPPDLAAGAWRFESLADLARALDGAGLFVGNDSGVTHLAAILGVPCMVFFGPMNPAVWKPRGALVRVVAGERKGMPAADIPFALGRASLASFLVDLRWISLDLAM